MELATKSLKKSYNTSIRHIVVHILRHTKAWKELNRCNYSLNFKCFDAVQICMTFLCKGVFTFWVGHQIGVNTIPKTLTILEAIYSLYKKMIILCTSCKWFEYLIHFATCLNSISCAKSALSTESQSVSTMMYCVCTCYSKPFDLHKTKTQ